MPAMLVGSYNENHIRKYIHDALESTRGCVVEIILKDTHTLENHPERMHRWLKIAREEIARFTAGKWTAVASSPLSLKAGSRR